jgi:hypothetical protein
MPTIAATRAVEYIAINCMVYQYFGTSQQNSGPGGEACGALGTGLNGKQVPSCLSGGNLVSNRIAADRSSVAIRRGAFRPTLIAISQCGMIAEGGQMADDTICLEPD